MLRFVVICVVLATVNAERRGFGYNHGSYTHTASNLVSAPSHESHSKVVSAGSTVHSHGFDYHVATSNGISSKASGDGYGRIHGGFQWISPEGKHVALSYVADENGYRPDSSILPTPPPIPEAILKSLKYIQSHPYKEEVYQHHPQHQDQHHHQHQDQHHHQHQDQHQDQHHHQHQQQQHKYHYKNLRF